MAEALFNHLGEGHMERSGGPNEELRVFAQSAGSFPTGIVHPKALATIADNGIRATRFHSKSWDELGDEKFDLVITVCDRAAGEMCPIYLKDVIKTHWGVRDPAAFDGSAQETTYEFAQVFKILEMRIKAFLALDFESLSPLELKTFADAIGAS